MCVLCLSSPRAPSIGVTGFQAHDRLRPNEIDLWRLTALSIPMAPFQYFSNEFSVWLHVKCVAKKKKKKRCEASSSADTGGNANQRGVDSNPYPPAAGLLHFFPAVDARMTPCCAFHARIRYRYAVRGSAGLLNRGKSKTYQPGRSRLQMISAGLCPQTKPECSELDATGWMVGLIDPNQALDGRCRPKHDTDMSNPSITSRPASGKVRNLAYHKTRHIEKEGVGPSFVPHFTKLETAANRPYFPSACRPSERLALGIDATKES
ncbi:hypothetical protein B0T19DRAFT_150165 [Cercophora scortea]|uniref:Uncharacterized protein n=1 Tax=Cercophora scortea TaxID=314031 RepID=A0AAE0IKS2_9PEZI|nr:hypothetical protein B0T19DRAFT_150165 [Cercophora scortea]